RTPFNAVHREGGDGFTFLNHTREKGHIIHRSERPLPLQSVSLHLQIDDQCRWRQRGLQRADRLIPLQPFLIQAIHGLHIGQRRTVFSQERLPFPDSFSHLLFHRGQVGQLGPHPGNPFFLGGVKPKGHRPKPYQPQDHEQEPPEKIPPPPGGLRQQIHPHTDIPPSSQRPIGTDREGPSEGGIRSRSSSPKSSPGNGLIVTDTPSGFNRSRNKVKSTPSPVSTHSRGNHPALSRKLSRTSRRAIDRASPYRLTSSSSFKRGAPGGSRKRSPSAKGSIDRDMERVSNQISPSKKFTSTDLGETCTVIRFEKTSGKE